jgi:hypothetical protein
MDKEYPRLPRELRQLIAKVEGLEIEAKETLSEDVLTQLSKSCASFANTQGGSIIIGVNRNGKIVGANVNQQLMDRISSEAANCKPPVKVQLNLYQEKGKTVLQVLVPKSEYLHTDKTSRFPLRTGSVTSFMDLGMILAYAKERNLVGGEPTLPAQTRERRKPDLNELKPYSDGLSHKDSRVRLNALNNLASLVYSTAIETHKELLPKLAKVLQDQDSNVRKSAFRLYELLDYHALPSHKRKYNKKILPIVIEVINHDGDIDVRKQALIALAGTGDRRAIRSILRMICRLSGDEYKVAIPDQVFYSLVNTGLGPEFRRALFKEFKSNKNEDTRRRIEEITQRYNLG